MFVGSHKFYDLEKKNCKNMLMHQWLNIFLCFGQICTFNILKHKNEWTRKKYINPLNAELNPIRHLLAVVGARHIVHVSRIRVKDS